MKITPLAFDSFGARSMATLVETGDANILIDAGVALGPNRYGLPPHSKEIEREKKLWEQIEKAAKKADVFVITHYHLDHYNPDKPGIFKGKTVYAKNPSENINDSQRKRAEEFMPALKKNAKKVEWADGKNVGIGKTKIEFSQPVFHGPNEKLGFVVQTFIEDGKERFVHTSDVEGPTQQNQMDFLYKHKPQTAFVDGPLSYLLYTFGMSALTGSMQNLIHLVEDVGVQDLIVDHHFLRDQHYLDRLEAVLSHAAKKKANVTTAAEYAGKKLEPFEFQRKQLYEKWPEEIDSKEKKRFLKQNE